MKWIFIEPEDVWFFRDARAFVKGGGYSTAKIIFPPSPQTVTGALRSLILGNYPNLDMTKFETGADKDLYRRIGKPGDLGPEFCLRGPFFARRLGDDILCYTQLPQDVYYTDQDNHRFGAYHPIERSPFESAWSSQGSALHPLWPPHGQRQDGVEEPYWVNSYGVDDYLAYREFGALLQSELFVVSPRTGIERDPDLRIAKNQMLYTAPFIYLRNYLGLLVGVNDELDLPFEKGLLNLGGEGRAARFQNIPKDSINFLPSSAPANKQRIKIVLTTPAYFEDGWHPKDWNWQAVGLPPGAKLISAALGKPQYAGGWDVNRRKPKPMHAFIPAGSVYYFEFSKPLKNSIDLNNLSFTESPEGEEDYRRMGFGQCIIGTWDWQTV